MVSPNNKMTVHFLLPFLFILSFLLGREGKAQDSSSEVIERAMADELKRNLEELSLEGKEKPFFISYSINDMEGISISASLGALIQSRKYPVRNKSVRLLVGDYDFNDESLDIYSNSGPSIDFIDMPIDNDYHGIRRSLWITTDGVYKSAADIFEKSKQYVKEQELPLEKLPHRKFVKAPVVQINLDSLRIPYNPNLTELEELVRELSAVFKEEKDIENSMVNLSFLKSNHYFLNSEGTKVKYPKAITSLQIYAEMKTEQGESVFDQLIHHSFTPSSLPAKEQLLQEIGLLIKKLKKSKEAKVFEDSYYGPVLFVGKSAGAVFSSTFFGGESLILSNDISTRRNSYQFGGGRGASLDDKIGKKIVDSQLTIKSTPHLKNFQDEPLLGSYVIDAEGVVPPEELTLVENGTLLALLNNRITASENHVLNGHSRGFQRDAPGVIQFTSKNGRSLAELKKELIIQAKEAELPYAIMVKDVQNGNYTATNIYKVSLEDGSEELFRLAQIKPLSMNDLRDMQGISKELFVYNAPAGGMGVSSFIVPDGLLLKGMEIEGSKGPFLGKKVEVENPLKGSEK